MDILKEALDRLKERLKKPQQVKETGQSKPAKRIRKKPSISSSSEDIEPESPPYMDSDNSGEFWREFEDGNMNNTEDVDQTRAAVENKENRSKKVHEVVQEQKHSEPPSDDTEEEFYVSAVKKSSGREKEIALRRKSNEIAWIKKIQIYDTMVDVKLDTGAEEPITNEHIDDDASIQSNDEPYQSSSSEYVPSSYSSSHEGDEDDYANLRKELILANSTLCDEPSTKMLSNLPVSPLELACQLQEVPKSMKSPVFPLQICDKFQIPDNSSDREIETTAYVNRAKKTISGSRVYDKRHACYFCDKLIGTVTRHLELVHFKEIEVAKLLTMDKNSERRKERFLCLLRAGDYYHDCQILAMKKDFQDSSISSSTDKPLATISPEILPIQTIQIDLEQVAHSENYRVIDFEDEEELLSEPEPFGSGGSESEYLPSDESRSSSIVPDTPENMLLSDTECDQASRSLPVDHSEKFFSTDTDNLSSVVTSSINKTKTKELVQINCAKKTSNGKRIRNKDHSCYFCHKLLRNLARHFERAHSNKTEVARILSMPKNSKRRREAFNALTRNGDFYHNCDVLLLKKGELILTRRPTEQEKKFLKYSDYGPCPECLGFMIKRHIWHHLKYSCICIKDKNILSSEKSSRLPAAESTSLLNGIYGHNLTEDFRSNILSKLRNDEITEICRKDDLILRFGAFLYEKYSSTQTELIRQSMRQLGRLTIELAKKNTHVHKLIDALTPEHFDAVVSATKSLCVTTNEIAKRTEFEIPSLALKIGYSIRKCIGIERGLCLRKGDLKRNEILLGFLSILDLEWSVRISSNALATLQSRKLNSVDLLPVTGDLIKFSKFLECMIKETKNDMNKERSFQNWSKLASLTLSRIILFNKRRSGEAARMKIEHYTRKPSWQSQVDQGKAHTFAGKSLEDIELKDLPPIEEDYPDQNDDEADDGETPTDSADVSSRSTTNDGRELTSEPLIGKKKQKSKNNKPKRTKREAALGRVPWSDSEKKVLLKKFKIEIKNEIVPGKDKCTKIKEEHNDVLSRRSWTDIKFFVKNVITRNKINKN
ncbi:hypothetical protein RN001_001932 [Aquatica leii]|uniref:Uncharacterized protein n=1 Tax=Aquatica leii TaxID=1421715 RepID=A0AAN7SCZ4_9COLE|nr:hypothetical protein RN001_001932 [Aquatica leii]